MRAVVDVSNDKSDADVISLMMEFALFFLSLIYKNSSMPNTFLAIHCGNIMASNRIDAMDVVVGRRIFSMMRCGVVRCGAVQLTTGRIVLIRHYFNCSCY